MEKPGDVELDHLHSGGSLLIDAHFFYSRSRLSHRGFQKPQHCTVIPRPIFAHPTFAHASVAAPTQRPSHRLLLYSRGVQVRFDRHWGNQCGEWVALMKTSPAPVWVAAYGSYDLFRPTLEYLGQSSTFLRAVVMAIAYSYSTWRCPSWSRRCIGRYR